MYVLVLTRAVPPVSLFATFKFQAYKKGASNLESCHGDANTFDRPDSHSSSVAELLSNDRLQSVSLRNPQTLRV